MNIFCTILLIAAAGVIGRLWPRKNPPPTTTAPEPTTSIPVYGLFLPPNCDSVSFRNLKHYHTYHNDDYDSIGIDEPQKIQIEFQLKSDYFIPNSRIKGEVK